MSALSLTSSVIAGRIQGINNVTYLVLTNHLSSVNIEPIFSSYNSTECEGGERPLRIAFFVDAQWQTEPKHQNS